MAAARDLWWSCKPPQLTRLKKDDPSTWIGGFTEEEHSSDDENNVSSGHWGCRMVGGSDAFLDMLPRACWGAVEQLCGAGTLIEPDGVTKPGANFAHPGANFAGVGSPGRASRGVYCNMPADISAEERAAELAKPLQERIGGGHCDGWDGARWRLSLATFLDDLPPGGGALSLWPRRYPACSRPLPSASPSTSSGRPTSHPRLLDFCVCSHHRLYPLRQASLSGEKPPGGWISDAAGQLVPNPAFAEETARIMKDTVPVECCGKAGTVVYAATSPRRSRLGCGLLTHQPCTDFGTTG